jgi:signal transduction histidine kinase
VISRSLRLRLIVFAAVAIAIALWTAWQVMGTLFEHYTEQRMASTLAQEGNALVAAIRIGPDGRPIVDPTNLEAAFRRRASGLYWEVVAPTGAARSASLAGKSLAISRETGESAPTPWRESEIPGPFETDLILIERTVDFGAVRATIRVGQDDEPLDRAQASFVKEMAQFLTALGIALSLAAWVQVELGLWPLRRVEDELAEMQHNSRRRLGDSHPREIDSLVGAINALAEARGDDLVRARQRAANLAHALKTPLAALAAQSRLARAAGAGEAADAIDQTLSAAGAALESELARARAAASRTAGTGAVTRPAALIEQLFAVLERTEAGMTLVFDADIPREWVLGIEAETVAECFGNLLDNAAAHARRVVRVVGTTEPEYVRFDVRDDGPGIAESDRETVLRRGVRLDESGSGHGLGLAIVADLVEATSGAVALGAASEGGLAVTIRWPAALLTRFAN